VLFGRSHTLLSLLLRAFFFPRPAHPPPALSLSLSLPRYILGGNDGANGKPAFWVVTYRGHTMQGSYDGAFIYYKEKTLPKEMIPDVNAVLKKRGWTVESFTAINNACPAQAPLDKSGQKKAANPIEGFMNEVRDITDLVEWVKPGTLKADWELEAEAAAAGP